MLNAGLAIVGVGEATEQTPPGQRGDCFHKPGDHWRTGRHQFHIELVADFEELSGSLQQRKKVDENSLQRFELSRD
jgi:hypothetical protein